MRKIVFIFLVSLYFFWVSYAWIIYNWSSRFDVSNDSSSVSITLDANIVPKNSTMYKDEGKRMYVSSGTLVSDVYWTFTNSWTIYLYNIWDSSCWNEPTYNFWTTGYDFHNNDWWKWYSIIYPDSYLCPDSWLINIELTKTDSDIWFESITINDWTVNYDEITVVDNNWNEVTLDDRILFSDNRFAFDGMTNNEINISNEFTWWSDNQQKANSVNGLDYGGWYDASWYALLMRNLSKNIVKYTNWLTWEKSLTTLNSFSKEFTLYDYSWTEDYTASNLENKWKILTLENTNGIEVSWQKNLIVKWWNLYIKSDIYNKDKNSLLVIVVQRDLNKRKNGWNVYIDPSVTNIDAVIISEWSILNFQPYNYTTYFRWRPVSNSWYRVVTNSSSLKNQLLIYWSIATRNSIWENKTVYGSDHYVLKNSEEESGLYNLENLRYFQIGKSDQLDESDSCYDIDWKIVALSSEDTSVKNAFAWKKECYLDDSTSSNLRSTFRTASTVVEYNPSIQNLSPKLLK